MKNAIIWSAATLCHKLTHILKIAIFVLIPTTAIAQTTSSVDFDNNGEVGFGDFLLFAQAFGSTNTVFDLDGDGRVGFGDFLSFVTFFKQPTPPSTTLPNILLIIADDMGIEATPGYDTGSEKPSMPNLEELIANGIVFDNVWANPLCSPTRATILTGKYGFRTGVVSPRVNEIGLTETSLQKYLTDHAPTTYQHAVIGKWHLSGTSNGGVDNPNLMGVGHYAGLLSGVHTDYSNWSLVTNGQRTNSTNYSTTVFTDLAIDWVSQQQNPWFLWTAYTAPHTPIHLPPASLLQNNTLSGTTADINANPLPYYLAMIQAMDTEIGRLLKAIDRDNTLIIFIGDNGSPRRAIQSPYRPARAKGTVYEGGIHVPMIIAGKGVTRKGERESALINSTDLFATIADIAGTELEEIYDSKSFKKLLTGDTMQTRSFLYSEVLQDDGTHWAVRNTTYKLLNFGNNTQAFYNLSIDPYEQNNLINNLDSDASQAKINLETLVQNMKN